MGKKIVRRWDALIATVVLLLVLPMDLCAQQKAVSIKFDAITRRQLDAIQICYLKSPNFRVKTWRRGKEITAVNKEGKVRLFNPLFFHNCLLSVDKEFIAYIYPGLFFDAEEAANDDIFSTKNLNALHQTRIEDDYLYNRMTENELFNRDRQTSYTIPLHYYSAEYARSTCNADSIMAYSLKVFKPVAGLYRHCKAVVIQRNGRGSVFFYCFYTDEAKDHLQDYIDALLKMFWYREPAEFIPVKKYTPKKVIKIKRRKKKYQPTVIG